MEEHAELIDKLGGGTAVASALWGAGCDSKHREAVYKWKRNGIPWRYRIAVAGMANAQRIPLPAGFLAAHGDPLPNGLTAA